MQTRDCEVMSCHGRQVINHLNKALISSLPAIQGHMEVLLLTTVDYNYDWCCASEYTLKSFVLVFT